MFGDIFLTHGVHESEKWHARYSKKDSPAYFYYYTYDGEWNMLKDMIGLKIPGKYAASKIREELLNQCNERLLKKLGAIHGEDMDYIFSPKGMQLPPLPPDSPGRYNLERMISFTTNFAKYG